MPFRRNTTGGLYTSWSTWLWSNGLPGDDIDNSFPDHGSLRGYYQELHGSELDGVHPSNSDIDGVDCCALRRTPYTSAYTLHRGVPPALGRTPYTVAYPLLALRLTPYTAAYPSLALRYDSPSLTLQPTAPLWMGGGLWRVCRNPERYRRYCRHLYGRSERKKSGNFSRIFQDVQNVATRP